LTIGLGIRLDLASDMMGLDCFCMIHNKKTQMNEWPSARICKGSI